MSFDDLECNLTSDWTFDTDSFRRSVGARHWFVWAVSRDKTQVRAVVDGVAGPVLPMPRDRIAEELDEQAREALGTDEPWRESLESESGWGEEQHVLEDRGTIPLHNKFASSPDGSRTAYTSQSEDAGHVTIDGDTRSYPGMTMHSDLVIFSPDSRRVAYGGHKVGVKGSGFCYVDDQHFGFAMHFFNFSPDSQHFAAHGWVENDRTVVVIDGDFTFDYQRVTCWRSEVGTTQRTMSESEFEALCWSPDSSCLAHGGLKKASAEDDKGRWHVVLHGAPWGIFEVPDCEILHARFPDADTFEADVTRRRPSGEILSHIGLLRVDLRSLRG